MIELLGENRKKLEPLFRTAEDTLIWSYLQGHMGRGWADNADNPRCGCIIVADFAFVAGEPNCEGAEKIFRSLTSEIGSSFILMIPQNPNWESLIEQVFEDSYEKFSRYAILKEGDCFDRNHLQQLVSTLNKNEGYQLRQIDEELYSKTFDQDFSCDFCSSFLSAEDYVKRGLGYCILHEGKIVSGASSYTIYDDGIEIEIATHNDYRQKGLATIVAAKLILTCLAQGKYPSWDAANIKSVQLAEKLGYHRGEAYNTYAIQLK